MFGSFFSRDGFMVQTKHIHAGQFPYPDSTMKLQGKPKPVVLYRRKSTRATGEECFAGLVLLMFKRMRKGHRRKIGFASEPGQGTQAYVFLPYDPQEMV
jgi:hypothetical protein